MMSLERCVQLRTSLHSIFAKMMTARKPFNVSLFDYQSFNVFGLDIWRSCKNGDLDMVRILIRMG